MGGELTAHSYDDFEVVPEDVIDDGFNVVFEGVVMVLWVGFRYRDDISFSVWKRMLNWIEKVKNNPNASAEEKLLLYHWLRKWKPKRALPLSFR